MSKPKYFYGENVNRRIRTSNQREIQFQVIGYFGGTWYGIFAATDPADIAGLTGLASNPASAIREISKEEFDGFAKKKPEKLDGYNPISPVPMPPPRQVSLSGDGAAVVVENHSPDEAEEPVTAGPVKAEDVLHLGKI